MELVDTDTGKGGCGTNGEASTYAHTVRRRAELVRGRRVAREPHREGDGGGEREEGYV